MAKRKHTATDTDYKVVSDGLQPRDMWRTPEVILAPVRRLFGGKILWDPASDEGNPTGAWSFGTPSRPLSFSEFVPPCVPTPVPECCSLLESAFLNMPFSKRNDWIWWFAVWVYKGVLLTPYETAPAFEWAKKQGWILIKPKGRIAFDTPPVEGIENESRPTGPTILFAKGYTFEEVRRAFPLPEFTVWRCT